MVTRIKKTKEGGPVL